MDLSEKIFNLLTKFNHKTGAGLLQTAYKEFPELALRLFDSISSLKPELAKLILKILPDKMKVDILGVQEVKVRIKLSKDNR